MNIAYPFRFNAAGRTAATDDAGHIRDLIEQVLFTSPVNGVKPAHVWQRCVTACFQPGQRCGCRGAPTHDSRRTAQSLGDLIQATNVEATVEESTLRVKVSYLIRNTQQRSEAEFTRGTA